MLICVSCEYSNLIQKILSSADRPPGLPSSRLGLEILTGQDTDISFGDYLNTEYNLDNKPFNFNIHQTHNYFEQKLGDKADTRMI